MSYPPQSWPPLQPQYPPSDPQTEHRLTVLEVVTNHHEKAHEEHYDTTDKHRERMNFHERLILLMCGVLSIVLQDKWPKLAALLKGAMP